MSIATVTDVADSLGRPIAAGAETTQVQTWLDRVENRIRARVPGFDTLILDAVYAAAVRGVEVDVVIRRIHNPTGIKSERIDDYATSYSDASATANLWPTDDEWSELTPTVERGAFTIRPQYST